MHCQWIGSREKSTGNYGFSYDIWDFPVYKWDRQGVNIDERGSEFYEYMR